MPTTDRTLLTGFTAFDRFAVNPSALLAESSGRPFVLLEVAYAAVDEFVQSVDLTGVDRVVLMGVAGTSSGFRLETLARNRLDRIPDVRGEVPVDAFIDAAAPALLPGTLWPAELLNHPPTYVVPSDDAGGYLCNYLYFRMLRRFIDKPIGFLHVPPLDRLSLDDQRITLRLILGVLEESCTHNS